ncbi:MAG TPA: hypothetical protein VKV74_07920, partial [Bryobacteraceae bacterium]|nr:hypothetical protein [Bryobacteraceae bacterium]
RAALLRLIEALVCSRADGDGDGFINDTSIVLSDGERSGGANEDGKFLKEREKKRERRRDSI